MNDAKAIAKALGGDFQLYQELLALVSAEGQRLRSEGEFVAFEYYQARKRILTRLDESLEKLRDIRVTWSRLSPAERAQAPEVSSLIRSNQDLVMKILVMDRENEQGLLRRGLLPAKAIPPLQRQKPNFVAGLYRRNGGGSAT